MFLSDWLGTKRMELNVTSSSTSIDEQCLSLPYGDELNCTGSDIDLLHFTGKEPDTESGNDYFGARYWIYTADSLAECAALITGGSARDTSVFDLDTGREHRVEYTATVLP